MHLTDHISDVQLNEYLDNETTEREQIESHLSSCEDCARRLTALQTLFAEIESLPELELTSNIAARIVSSPSLTPHLPHWLTLTATLQAAFALVVVIVAAPFVVRMLPAVEAPSFTDLILLLQSQWRIWLDIFATFQLPTMPQLPVLELSSLMLTLTLAIVSLLWLVGNGLLLRRLS